MKTGAYLILAILLLALVSNVAASSSIAQKFGSTDVQPNGIAQCVTKLFETGQTVIALFLAIASEELPIAIGLVFKLVQDILPIINACFR